MANNSLFFFPSGGEFEMDAMSATSLTSQDTVYVYRIVLPGNISIRYVNWRLDTGVSSGKFGISIYSEDGNTRILDTGPITADIGSPGYLSQDLGSQVALTAGTYWLAFSGNSASIQVRALLSPGKYALIGNPSGTPICGTAANASSGGQNPSTLGTITGTSSIILPGFVFKS